MNRVKYSLARGFFHVSERLRGTKTAYRRIKSFLILIFVALAIFLTGQLWFVHLSNRNFFLYLTARWNPAVAEGYRDFVRPMRSIYGDGTGRFDISYSGITAAGDYFDLVLTELFDNGNFIGVNTVDYNRLFSRPLLMFQYAFDMPGAVFPLGFNQRSGAFLVNRGVTAFDTVAIWLPYGNRSGLSVFFIGGGLAWEFSVDSTRLADGFPVHMISTNALYFVSAALEEHEGLYPGVFIPQIGDFGWYAHHPIIAYNPYHTNIGGAINHIRNQVSPFFDNPATIHARVAGDGVWTFSNIHTAVRYFETDVLEYASFRPRPRNATTSLIGDFSAALAFIDSDIHVINEFYLTGFEPRGDGFVFWFGYIAGNFPIIFPNGWHASSRDDILPAPIEVVVEQGRVVLYRRIAHNFHLYEGTERMREVNVEAFIRERDEPLHGMSIGYRIEPGINLDNKIILEWQPTEGE